MEGRQAEGTSGQIQVIGNNVPAPMLAIQDILSGIPVVELGSYDGILERLLEAKNAADLERAFTSSGIDDYFDRWISIMHVKQAPSDFQSGTGVFLILDIIDEESGEKDTITTGSVAIVATIAIASAKDLLPLTCMPVKSQKATRSGFYPHQLRIHPDQHRRRKEVTLPPEPRDDTDLPF